MSKLEKFIEAAKNAHKGENIDYSQVVYINNRTKVKLIDPIYGEYWQTPSNHLKGQSHPMRKKSKISSSKRLSHEDVIKRFEEVHNGENLDYSKVEYVNMHTKVCIIDPIYGEYWQEPSVHLKGCGHPQRGLKRIGDASRYTTEKFKMLARNVFGDRFDLSEVDYVGSQEKVKIICPKHGEFWQYPDAFLQGKSCPKCGNHLSCGEDELYNILVERLGSDDVLKNDRKTIGKELDIYIPSLNMAIEYNGLRWHSEQFGKDCNYHLRKLNECKRNGINLIQIFEDEWLSNKDLVIEKILRILKIESEMEKIDARKCQVCEVDNKTAESFLAKNHIQGYCHASIHLGMYYKDGLVGLMSFKRIADDKFELVRFATLSKTLCRGCGGKLFNYFVKKYHPIYIKSFADRRWTMNEDDNLYVKLGFHLSDILKPNYRYTNGHGKRIHKFLCRKKRLNRKYGFPLDMTEREMMEKLGFYRIWDCGLFKYEWRKEDN